VFDIPRDLEDTWPPMTQCECCCLLWVCNEFMHIYIGHLDSSLVLYEIYIGICIRLVIYISHACYFTAMWVNVDHYIGRDYSMFLVLNV
jgi:hypothetical protein